jgi:hypothetical protein
MSNYSPAISLGDGVQTNFVIPWTFLNRDHVQVFVGEVLTPFTFVDDGNITISPAPADGTVVKIIRVTPGDVLVNYSAGFVRSSDLNFGYKQALFRADEVSENDQIKFELISEAVNDAELFAQEAEDARDLIFQALEDVEDLGLGDMLKFVYDSNSDGKVNAADVADLATNATNAVNAANADFATNAGFASTSGVANAVSFANVTGKPTTLAGYSITGTKAEFDAAVSDGDLMYVGDALAGKLTAGTFKVFFSDASGVITELPLGTAGQVLTSNGPAVAPAFATVSGVTRISGNTGAAGPFETWQVLTANYVNATTVNSDVMSTTSVDAGVWEFEYHVIWQQTNVSGGIRLSVTHSGTFSEILYESDYIGDTDTSTPTSLVAAFNTQADPPSSGDADVHVGKMSRTSGGSVSIDGSEATNVDYRLIVRGTIVVTATGTLKLIGRTNTSNQVTIKDGSNLVLKKIA